MFGLRQLKKKILSIKLKTAELKLGDQYMLMRPSRQLPITVRREGTRWLCLFECDSDILNCVVAYGDCPEQATMNFDYMWNGIGGFKLEMEEEDDEPEQF